MYRLFLVLILALTGNGVAIAHEKPVVFEGFSRDWLFHRGDVDGAQYLSTIDSTWRIVNIPHDWSIENLPGTNSPFDPKVVTGISGAFATGGTGWYRKHFYADPSYNSDRFLLQFDGIYMNADIWVNDRYVGNHFYGYTPFEIDITEYINHHKDNLIAVRVRNEGLNCRWYTGSGIYREVALKIVSSLRLVSNGTYVTTPHVLKESATVKVVSTLINQAKTNKSATVRLTFIDPKENMVSKTEQGIDLFTGQTKDVRQEIKLPTPQFWSLDNPHLYRVITEIWAEGVLTDRTEQPFGIRTISFDAENGFRLNGKMLLLKGGSIHHDNGPLGSKAYPRAEERKIELLKKAGFNALRMAHNPPSKALLDACDRLGMLVIDEAFDSWRYGHYPSYDFSQYFDRIWEQELTAMLKRDRNHPSVILWSIGNEIKRKDTPEIVAMAKNLGDLVRELDPARSVTAGVNTITDLTDDFLGSLDVCGYNYVPGRYLTDHERHPQRVMYGSESYASKAYDYRQAVKNYPWVVGDFIWTAFDYLGESGIGWCGYPLDNKHYPWNHAFCGDLDINGSRRPQSLFRETLWSDNPVAHIVVIPPVPSFELNPDKEDWSIWDWPDAVRYWTFPGYEGQAIEVVVYTNCSSAELFLNGKSLGKKKKNEADKNQLKWRVPYKAGELKVIGYEGNKKTTKDILQTAGPVSRIHLSIDRNRLKADGKDLSYINIRLTDEKGVLVPGAQNTLRFTLTGDAVPEAVSNSNPMSTEAFIATTRKTWRGEAMAVIRAGYREGTAVLTVSSDDLEPVSVTIYMDQ